MQEKPMKQGTLQDALDRVQRSTALFTLRSGSFRVGTQGRVFCTRGEPILRSPRISSWKKVLVWIWPCYESAQPRILGPGPGSKSWRGVPLCLESAGKVRSTRISIPLSHRPPKLWIPILCGLGAEAPEIDAARLQDANSEQDQREQAFSTRTSHTRQCKPGSGILPTPAHVLHAYKSCARDWTYAVEV